jgi:hypothetical protein
MSDITIRDEGNKVIVDPVVRDLLRDEKSIGDLDECDDDVRLRLLGDRQPAVHRPAWLGRPGQPTRSRRTATDSLTRGQRVTTKAMPAPRSRQRPSWRVW